MGQVIRIAALIMGLFLLILTLGGWAVRPKTNTERVALVIQDQPTANAPSLMQVWPSVPRPLIITRNRIDSFLLQYIDPTGKTAYFIGLSDSLTSRVVYRLKGDDLPIRPILKNITTMTASPDFAWLMYAERGSDPLNYKLTSLSSRQQWNLTEQIAPLQLAYPPLPFFSSDTLYLSVFDPHTLAGSILRFTLTDGTTSTLLETPDPQAVPTVLGQVGKWLIIHSGARLYRMRLDDSHLELLIPDDWQPDGPLFGEGLLDFYDEYGLALIQRADSTLGVDVATRQIRWQYDNLLTVDLLQPTANGCLMTRQFNVPTRLCLPTGELQGLPVEIGVAGAYVIGLSPDANTTYYSDFGSPNRSMTWWRFNWGTRQTSPIATTKGFGSASLSYDGRWIWASSITTPTGLFRISTTDGHVERLLNTGYYQILGWMLPHIFDWQPIKLGFVAGILIILGFLPRRLTKISRRTLSSLRGH